MYVCIVVCLDKIGLYEYAHMATKTIQQSESSNIMIADAANKHAVSFIFTRLDYYNSLFAGLPYNKFQHIQTHAE